MLMKVYSPDGTMYEVTPSRAKKLLLLGWTFSANPKPLFKSTSPLSEVTESEALSAPLEPETPLVPAFTEFITIKSFPQIPELEVGRRRKRKFMEDNNVS